MRSVSVLNQLHFSNCIFFRTINLIKIETIIAFYTFINKVSIFRLLLKINLKNKLRHKIFFSGTAIYAFCKILISMCFCIHFSINTQHLLCGFYTLRCCFFLDIGHCKINYLIYVHSAIFIFLRELCNKSTHCCFSLIFIKFVMSNICHRPTRAKSFLFFNEMIHIIIVICCFCYVVFICLVYILNSSSSFFSLL